MNIAFVVGRVFTNRILLHDAFTSASRSDLCLFRLDDNTCLTLRRYSSGFVALYLSRDGYYFDKKHDHDEIELLLGAATLEGLKPFNQDFDPYSYYIIGSFEELCTVVELVIIHGEIGNSHYLLNQ